MSALWMAFQIFSGVKGTSKCSIPTAKTRIAFWLSFVLCYLYQLSLYLHLDPLCQFYYPSWIIHDLFMNQSWMNHERHDWFMNESWMIYECQNFVNDLWNSWMNHERHDWFMNESWMIYEHINSRFPEISGNSRKFPEKIHGISENFRKFENINVNFNNFIEYKAILIVILRQLVLLKF